MFSSGVVNRSVLWGDQRIIFRKMYDLPIDFCLYCKLHNSLLWCLCLDGGGYCGNRRLMNNIAPNINAAKLVNNTKASKVFLIQELFVRYRLEYLLHNFCSELIRILSVSINPPNSWKRISISMFCWCEDLSRSCHCASCRFSAAWNFSRLLSWKHMPRIRKILLIV